MTPSHRSSIPPFYVMQALSDAEKLAKQGRDIVHLSLGQPSARPPEAVLKEVAEKALSDPLAYTESAGIPALRSRIAQHYAEEYGLSIAPERVFITVGSSAAYMLALLAAYDVGDEVALVAPHYPASPNMMQALGVKPVIMRAGMEQNYQPTLAMLQSLPRKPKGLVIASPSNPAGTVIDAAELARITAYCEAEGIRIISDEIYHGVVYDSVSHPGGSQEQSRVSSKDPGSSPPARLVRDVSSNKPAKAETVLRFSQQMIVTNSFSKYYLLPGWRLGWCVLPEALIDPAHALLQNFFISPPTLSQYAALRVMDCRPELDAVVATYDANRRFLLQALAALGFARVAPAQGAFYLYVDVSHRTGDSAAFCRTLLKEAGICAVPGIDFDKEQGHRFMRLSYAGSMTDMQKAAERLKALLQANG